MIAYLVVMLTFVLTGLLWAFLLRPIREDLEQSRALMRDITKVFIEVPSLIEYLSNDLHRLAAQQDAKLENLVLLHEKAADRAFFTANRVADDLIDREEKVDAATEVVATNLAGSQSRADEASGEPGAAADAAALPPQQDTE